MTIYRGDEVVITQRGVVQRVDLGTGFNQGFDPRPGKGILVGICGNILWLPPYALHVRRPTDPEKHRHGIRPRRKQVDADLRPPRRDRRNDHLGRGGLREAPREVRLLPPFRGERVMTTRRTIRILVTDIDDSETDRFGCSNQERATLVREFAVDPVLDRSPADLLGALAEWLDGQPRRIEEPQQCDFAFREYHPPKLCILPMGHSNSEHTTRR